MTRERYVTDDGYTLYRWSNGDWCDRPEGDPGYDLTFADLDGRRMKMARNIPIISTREYQVSDEWGQTRTLHAWEIRRDDVLTETGMGYTSGAEALDFAIGVVEGRYA